MHKQRLELQEAHKLWETILNDKSAPRAVKAQAYAEIASLYHLSGDNATSRESLEKAQSLHVTSTACIKLAALAVADGDFESARGYLAKAESSINKVGENAKYERADLNFNLSAVICLDGGDIATARELLDSALVDVPDYGVAHMQLGVVLFRMGLIEDSLRSLEQACLLVPELAEVHNFLGEVLMSVDRKEEAVAAFDQALHVDSSSVLPLLNKGVMHLSRSDDHTPTEEDLQAALRFFNQAVNVDPSSEVAYIHRASYYCQVGDLKAALENYDLAIASAKSRPSLLEYLSFRALCEADLTAHDTLSKSFRQ